MPKRYLPALVLFISTTLGTSYAYYTESSYTNGFNFAEGIVIELGDQSSIDITTNGKTESRNTQAIVSFTAKDKSYISKGRGLAYPYWEIGKKAKILYFPKNPNISRIDRFDELYFFTILGTFFILVFIFLGSINYMVYKVRGKPFS